MGNPYSFEGTAAAAARPWITVTAFTSGWSSFGTGFAATS